MDDKIRAVLENPELMSGILAAVRGVAGGDERPSPPESESPPQALPPARPTLGSAVETLGYGGDRGLALLAALKPFLKESRRKKLDMASNVLSVAALYKNTKNI